MSVDTFTSIKAVVTAGIKWFTDEVSTEIDSVWEVIDFYWNLVQYEGAEMLDKVKASFGVGSDMYINIGTFKTDIETKLNTKYSIAVVDLRANYAEWMAKAKVCMNISNMKNFVLDHIKSWIF